AGGSASGTWQLESRNKPARRPPQKLELPAHLPQQALDDREPETRARYAGARRFPPRKRPQQPLDIGFRYSCTLVGNLDGHCAAFLTRQQLDIGAIIGLRSTVAACVLDQVADHPFKIMCGDLGVKVGLDGRRKMTAQGFGVSALTVKQIVQDVG